MDPLFSCPPPTALSSIGNLTCPEVWDQIVRFGFQRIQATPSFTPATIKTSAAWTPLLSASDSTKMVLTPKIPGIVIPPGELMKEGGNDNSTINGIPRVTHQGFVQVTGQTLNFTKAIRTAIRALLQESAIFPGETNLWVYMFNRFGQIICNTTDASGIKVYNVFNGDVGTEGLGRQNTSNFEMAFEGGWSNDAGLILPTAPFNPLNL